MDNADPMSFLMINDYAIVLFARGVFRVSESLVDMVCT